MAETILVRVDRRALRYAVPGSVFRQSEFKWRPQDVPGLTAERQVDTLTNWGRPGGALHANVVIITAYEQLRSEYAAAWLVEQHMQQNPQHDVLWFASYHDELERYTAEFKVPAKKREDPPTLIVVTNLGLQATSIQLEKVRELWHRWPGTPIIVSGYGRTPMELAKAACMPVYGAIHINPTREVLEV